MILFLCVCIHFCVWVVYLCACVQGNQGKVSGVPCHSTSLRQGFFRSQELLASSQQATSSLPLPSVAALGLHQTTPGCVGVGSFNSGSHPCVANILPTEPPLQPLCYFRLLYCTRFQSLRILSNSSPPPAFSSNHPKVCEVTNGPICFHFPSPERSGWCLRSCAQIPWAPAPTWSPSSISLRHCPWLSLV